MRAAIFHGVGRIEPEAELAMPLAGVGEVLVKVASCGICGSDMHIYRVQSRSSEEMYAGTLRVDADGQRIIGHEYAGVISAIGPGVEGWKVGERVVGVTGGGGMAEYVPVPVNPYQLVRVPDEVSFEEAATTEPLADSLQLVRKAAVQSGENVVVFGVGIIGLRRGAGAARAGATGRADHRGGCVCGAPCDGARCGRHACDKCHLRKRGGSHR